jgi:mono/diheme cytochrome c family protein
MALMAFGAPLNASPARPRKGAEAPVLPVDADEGRGRTLYAAGCAGCHGPRGQGDGPGAASLVPRPSDLSAHEYTGARLADALWNGVAGTAMQAWRDYSVDDLAALARVVRGFQTRQQVRVPDSLLALGQRVYDANCVQCHGAAGLGDGFAAAALAVAPTNFREQRPSVNQSLRALRDGIEGTRMAAWSGRLSDAEIVAVANYVRGYFAPDGGGGR